MKKLRYFFFGLLLPLSLFSQGLVEGRVTDELSGETLIGVNLVYSAGKGTVTDINGYYSISLAPGEYDITASYVGYQPETKHVVVTSGKVTVDFEMKTLMLNEVEVVGDMALSRQTPVAFSTITPVKLQEELASQDIPMILNTTPGVYATQQGGGDGDARINIRGFSQRNVAVMIDGIPVNDMENGWVYWSNWFGLDLVTQRIQVQRGLGASKLALPSVGGTLNIITAGIDQKREIKFKQEVVTDDNFGFGPYYRSSLSFNSGLLPHGWGVTAAASFKTGTGWVDRTNTLGWFYYLKIDKKLGNHILSFSAMGAPQEHGQRRYTKPIATYDSTYARDLGVTEPPRAYFDTNYLNPDYMVNKGVKYNPDWGEYVDKNGNKVVLNEKKNYYHKPQFTLRDFWNINDKFYLSTILYLSLGNGGGTSLKNSVLSGQITPDGQIDFQKYYDDNTGGAFGAIDPLYPNEYKSSQFLRSQVNNHKWYGLLSTFNYTLSDKFTLSGGLDLRRYRGDHYEEVYDLIGGDYILNTDNSNRDPFQQIRVGDRIYYNDAGIVEWGGFFTQLEYISGQLSAFVNLTGAYSGYKKIDYFLPRVLSVGDTTMAIEWGRPVTYNGITYNQDSPGLKWQESDWYWKPGATIKAGANYNLSEHSNAFVNAGYLSKAPQFNNVYDTYSIDLLTHIENENIASVELGYTYSSSFFSLNTNVYYTDWRNAPGKPVSYPLNVNERAYGNIQGMDSRHMGLEFDFAWKIRKNLQMEGLFSLGDWRWTSSDSVKLYKLNKELAKVVYFDARGLHVGDAAQTQIGGSLRWAIIKPLYVKVQLMYFDRYYAEFSPFDLDPKTNPAGFDQNGNPKETWMMPSYYLVDLHVGYSFNIKKVRFDLRMSVLNLLNTEYISDARNNDTYSVTTRDNDAKSAGVFFGLGRRFNTSLTISF